MATKTLEILVRMRDQMTSQLEASRPALRAHSASLVRLDRDYRNLERAQRDAARAMAELDRRRSSVVADARSSPVRAEIDRLEAQRRLLRGEANQRAGTTQGDRALARSEALQYRINELKRNETREIERQRAAYAELAQIDQRRVALSQRMSEAAARRRQLASQIDQRAGVVLEQQRLGLLQRQAALGDRQAARRLGELSVARRHRGEQEALLGLLRSQGISQQRRLTAERQLLRLKQLQRREVQAAAASERMAMARRLGGSAITGASMAAFNPLVGLGIGAAAGAGGGAMLAAGGAAAGAFGLVKTQQVAAELEHSMARVRALTGATGEDFDALRSKVVQLGAQTVFTARQAAEAMQQFALAGLDVQQMLDASGPALDLAAAGQLEMAEAAKIVVRIMAGMGIAAEDVGGAVDVMVKTFTTANTDLRELGEAFKYVGPIGRMVGQEIHQTAAAVQVLSDAGLAGEMAGTGLRQVLLSLANQSGPAQEAMRELGVEVFDAQGNFRELADIIEDFERAFGGMGSGRQLEFLNKIFEARSAAAAAMLVQTGGARLREREAALADAGGTASRVAETQLDSTTGSMVRMKSAAESVAVTIGGSMLPALTRTADAATVMLRGLVSLSDWARDDAQPLLEVFTKLPLAQPAMWATQVPGWVIDQHQAEAEARERIVKIQREQVDLEARWVELMDQRRRDLAGARQLQREDPSLSDEAALQQVRADRQRAQTARELAQAQLEALAAGLRLGEQTRSVLEELGREEVDRLTSLRRALREVEEAERARTRALEGQVGSAQQRQMLESQLRELAQQRLDVEQAITMELAEQGRARLEAANAAREAQIDADRMLLGLEAQGRGPGAEAAQRRLAGMRVVDQVTAAMERLGEVIEDPAASARVQEEARRRRSELSRRLPELQMQVEAEVGQEQARSRREAAMSRADVLERAGLEALRDQVALGMADGAELARRELELAFARRNAELQAIIDDPSASSAEREAAMAQQGANDQLLAQRKARIEERPQTLEALSMTQARHLSFGAGAVNADKTPEQETAKNTAEVKALLDRVNQGVAALVELVRSGEGDLSGVLSIFDGR